jgi:capsular exopolysaccharide synthesis family protein
MSRIHEALKKAEQERLASQSDRQSRPGLGEPEKHAASSRTVEIAPEPEMATPSAGFLASGPDTESAVLPFDELKAKCIESAWNSDPKVQLFSGADPFAPGAEQFRTLRSRLYRIRESQPLHVLLVTSAMPAEGKTLVSANLAKVLAQQRGCKVLLIEADLRAPRQCALLGVPAGPGLVDYLQGTASESDVIQKSRENDLYFIQAGVHISHPAELISNGKFKKLLTRVAGLFDWIIIDSPPILPVSDAAVLSVLCDGVLMVVRAGTTPAEVSQRACQELGGAQIVGVVLNGVDKSAAGGSYYQYGYGQDVSKNSQK